MKINRAAAAPAVTALAAIVLLAGCSAQQVVPARPAPTPSAAPRPAPAPAPAPTMARPAPADWRDAAPTPGSWSYGPLGTASAAMFLSPMGERLFSLVCHKERGSLLLLRAGAASGSLPMSVLTTSGVRPFTAQPTNEGGQALSANLAAGDPVLDEMAFSRGRIAVEVNGLPTLYLPAWAEIGRVIEDCR